MASSWEQVRPRLQRSQPRQGAILRSARSRTWVAQPAASPAAARAASNIWRVLRPLRGLALTPRLHLARPPCGGVATPPLSPVGPGG